MDPWPVEAEPGGEVGREGASLVLSPKLRAIGTFRGPDMHHGAAGSTGAQTLPPHDLVSES